MHLKLFFLSLPWHRFFDQDTFIELFNKMKKNDLKYILS